MNLLGIAGSLRAGSFNRSLIRAAAAAAPDGVTVAAFGRLGEIPPYNDDEKQKAIPDAVTALAAEIRAADGLLIATPEYNYGVSGVLKNAIDWISRVPDQPFKDKPIGVMGAAMGGLGTARAQYDLRRSFIFLEGLVMNRPEIFVGAAHTKFDETGALTDEATREILTDYMKALAAWIERVG
ncbi:MAG: NAD(P)H-dependent oxidoreductase [Rhodospirillaceae bacterium]|nr:NAD(P)H-dependent oxidoreductase [Rhodospirillaceae bacterium]MYK59016.1 NAD(P)H-dependent oxidoreductase [Rhodospirillaceae bacterium]